MRMADPASAKGRPGRCQYGGVNQHPQAKTFNKRLWFSPKQQLHVDFSWSSRLEPFPTRDMD